MRTCGASGLAAVAALILILAGQSAHPVRSKAPPDKPLYVAIVWHMHQPYYRDPASGVYMLPWVRMHAVKDYYDMAAMLDRYPDVHVTFNLVPSLLKQLEDYAYRGAKDVYQIFTEKRADQLTNSEKEFILRRFFDANWDRIIKRYPRYRELLERRGTEGSDAEIRAAVRAFTEQDFRDLQVWFNLAWVDPDALEGDPAVATLVAKGRGFNEQDKEAVLSEHLEIMRQVIGVYRRLMDKGQIEVTTTPFYHPILPLVWKTDSARMASPGIALPPERFARPEDVAAQLEKAASLYAEHFGRRPAGLWPSEQAVGQDIVPYVAAAGFQWMISSEGVLAKSLGVELRGTAGELLRPDVLYQPYRVRAGDRQVAMVFRDIVLSDRIGFQYSGMPAAKAVDDLIGYLHDVQRRVAGLPGNHLVTIALDGENAWEWYENDGKVFLNGLYRRLSEDPTLETVTVGEYLQENPPATDIERLWTGSWISDNLETWIGEEEENRAWSYLREAREAVARYEARHAGDATAQDRVKAALEEVYAAEGSDWFWWYGSDEDSGNDPAFDLLFRTHLAAVYAAIGEPAPDYLDLPMVAAVPARPDTAASGRLTAAVDGSAGQGEWDQALRFTAPPVPEQSTRPGAAGALAQALYVAGDASRLYLRLDLAVPLGRLKQEGLGVRFYLSNPRQLAANARPRGVEAIPGIARLSFPLAYEVGVDLTRFPAEVTISRAAGGGEWNAPEVLPGAQVALGTGKGGRTSVLEVGVPFGALGLREGDAASVAVALLQTGQIVQVLPAAGPARVQVPEVLRGQRLFAWDDPVGDDHGPGTYVYPLNRVFTPGVFDMKRFEVFKEGRDVAFKVWLAGEIANVWNSPSGLSVQAVDIYIDTDRIPGSGQTKALGGRRVEFAPESAWEYAIWVEGWQQRIFAADNRGAAASAGVQAAQIRVSVDSAERTITIRVPQAAIGKPGPAWAIRSSSWGRRGSPRAAHCGCVRWRRTGLSGASKAGTMGRTTRT